MDRPQVVAYVLAGGQSTRMGRDKALLPYHGKTLLESIHAQLAGICGQAFVVGPAARYASLGLPLIEDIHPGCGPLSGIEAALAHASEWAFIAACDMPGLQNEAIREILHLAQSETEAKIIMPLSPDGLPEPLCAAYHRSILPAVRKSLETGVFKVTDALAGLPLLTLPSRPFPNVNTPAEWEALHG